MPQVIVGTYYERDDDKHAAEVQHGMYWQALGIIVHACNRYARFATRFLVDVAHQDWGTVETFDHRTLQAPHDLLAAAWRYRHDCRQTELQFPNVDHARPTDTAWLDWLRSELSAWIDCPHLVRAVQIILSNQNQPVGYLAESELCLGIMNRFNDVPWRASHREAYERDLLVERGAPGAETQTLTKE